MLRTPNADLTVPSKESLSDVTAATALLADVPAALPKMPTATRAAPAAPDAALATSAARSVSTPAKGVNVKKQPLREPFPTLPIMQHRDEILALFDKNEMFGIDAPVTF